MSKKIEKYTQIILDYAQLVAKENITHEDDDFISYRVDENSMLINKENTFLDKLTKDDIVEVKFSDESMIDEFALHKDIYQANPEINAIIHTHPVNATLAADAGKPIPAILDDMAQILGPTVKVAKDTNISSVKKAMRRRSACLINKDGMISTGRSMNEAFTGCMVLDKTTTCYVESIAFGGAKNINIIEAILMHVIYKKKYSAANQEQLIAKERSYE